ncbi:uncharacterized protein PODANS_5_4860 [Podospora anserina S mat+]|uniref:Podospora anserina S mat+ genomic DNA chromosome 5, supercontig 5 n=1 Tax=Podospora anserina (strain S / ATCC MYA-4624 / DSM 980 / FGSC 10383) TaxID=515849 RepID=B2AMQ6_PODAN|nr:uncharacterized protein PODANS_5_4860 [Podospora anserina S mat+]CAP65252.1 unnamed protein product [Podospora anserina S mat+]CDP29464.1 Putative protein of unknown function [Podospora anserina S mat+]
MSTNFFHPAEHKKSKEPLCSIPKKGETILSNVPRRASTYLAIFEMGRLTGLLLALLSPLCVLGSPKTVAACGSTGLSLFAEANYEGPCQAFSPETLDNTHQASCVDISPSIPVNSIYKGSSLSCCFLYEKPCPDPSSPFYPQCPNLVSQRVFVPGISDLCRFGWGKNTIKSIVCPDKHTCESLKDDMSTTTLTFFVEKEIEDPFTGRVTKKKEPQKREVSLRGYWLDLQQVKGHKRAI